MLTNIYNQRITILNKVRLEDSENKHEVWHKTVVDDAAWYFETDRAVNGTQVIIAQFMKILIPFHDNYLEYQKWKKLADKEGIYSMSIGDYIVLGDVEEEINSSNIVKVMQSYKPNVCQVKAIKTTHNRFCANVQLHIEGI